MRMVDGSLPAWETFADDYVVTLPPIDQRGVLVIETSG